MKVFSRSLSLMLVVVFVLAGTSIVAAGKKSDKRKPAAVQVGEWLMLGPVAHPMPLFHDAAGGGYKLERLFDDEELSIEPVRPERAVEQQWFGEQPLTWTPQAADRKGTVRLAEAGKGPQSAWLAAYVATDRWVAADLEILGEHPRAAWLDGKLLVKGGFERGADDAAKVSKRVELTPGRHLLMIRTVRNPEISEDWSVGVSFAAEDDASALPLEFSLDRRRTVELRDIMDAPRASSLAVAPLGRQVAYIMNRTVPGTDDNEAWIEIRGTAVRTKLVRTLDRGKSISRLDWTENGDYLSWLSRDGSKQSLYVSNHGRSKVLELLAEIEGLAGYRWLSDNKTIVYWVTEKAEEDKRGVKRLEGLMDRWAGFRDKRRLFLLSVPDGTRRALTAGDLSCEFQAGSPDGTKLLFSRQREDLSERPYSRSELWEVDLKTFESKLLREFGWLSGASYSPTGGKLLIRARPDEFGTAGVAATEPAVPNSYDTQAFIWDPATDEVDAISREFDPSIVEAVWNRADGKIYVVAEDRDYRRLFRYDEATRSFESIDTGVDVIREVDFAVESPAIVVAGSSAWQHQVLNWVSLEGENKLSTVFAPGEREWFSDVEFGSVEPWNFTSSAGRTIEGRVYLPPEFDSERKYPAIVYYYGGTSPVSREFGGRYPKEWWAARGYVVYVLQPTGATGFGQERSSVHVNDWGKTTSEEIIEGTRKFLAAHPYVDSDRVGCIGASYGGFMTMLLATKTDLFAAAVSHAGISSLSSYWGEGYWGYSYNSVAGADSFPWNRRDIYVDRSPLFRADQAKVPILLTHGRSDKNVPVGESDAFYVALKLLGKSVEYVQIEGEDHWIQDHAKRVVWSETILAWFDRWLKDQPEWWDSLYESDEKRPGKAE